MFKVGDIVVGINKPGWSLAGLTGKVVLTNSNYDDTCLVYFGGRHGEYYVNPELLRLDKGQMRSDKLNKLLDV